MAQPQNQYQPVYPNMGTTGGLGYQPPTVTGQPPGAYQPVPQPKAPHDDGTKFRREGCRDVIWAVLFILQLLLMIGLAIYMGKKHASDPKCDPKVDQDCNPDTQVNIDGKAWGIICLLIVGGALSCVFWLELIKRNANCLIWFCLLFSVAMFFILGLVLLFFGSLWGGLVFFILGGINLLYVYFVKGRIPFAAAILSVVSGVLQLFPASFAMAYLVVFIQAAWLIVWVIAAGYTLGEIERNKSTQNQQGLVYFLFLVSFFWTSQVVKNVMHVTVAGVVATWYFLFPQNTPPNPTKEAFKRATWTSFGSICLGSFIIAVVKALRTVARSAMNNKNEFVRCLVMCILNCLDAIVQYFNIYAFTQIAIYGKPYCEAAKDTWELLKNKGIDAIINDDLTGTVLAFGCIIGGLFGAVLGAVLGYLVIPVPNWWIWPIVGFLIGYAMTLVCMEVVASGIVALFVCFAEDPQALNETKPEVYNRFRNALTSNGVSQQSPLLLAA